MVSRGFGIVLVLTYDPGPRSMSATFTKARGSGMSSNGTPITGARVLQASGMVSVQAHCTPNEALGLMEVRASETHLPLAAIAAGIIDRSITFMPL